MADATHILLIEDDRFIGEMYARSLRKAGYSVDIATTGPQGLKAALGGNYDVILLDIMLPEQQGTEVLYQLRSTKKGDLVPNAKVIVLTNYSQDEESRLAMQRKADGYLIKADITPRKLIEIIQGFERN